VGSSKQQAHPLVLQPDTFCHLALKQRPAPAGNPVETMSNPVTGQGCCDLEPKAAHAIREEELGKHGIHEKKEERKATLEEHREAREGITINDPLIHNANKPAAHHNLQHGHVHAPGQEHKVADDAR